MQSTGNTTMSAPGNVAASSPLRSSMPPSCTVISPPADSTTRLIAAFEPGLPPTYTIRMRSRIASEAERPDGSSPAVA
ncbi:hypothetical protein A9O66_28850 [Paraburkholderia caribensis]|uniref:Uncharacterized protein n=1 Tax=Paraburkholderia caribensis TaxID=75105 RepID=A0A9Q6WPJ1_9BURK|nr:hypothetical protein A9O66_28850 [Paraburkholderia caribensis]